MLQRFADGHAGVDAEKRFLVFAVVAEGDDAESGEGGKGGIGDDLGHGFSLG